MHIYHNISLSSS